MIRKPIVYRHVRESGAQWCVHYAYSIEHIDPFRISTECITWRNGDIEHRVKLYPTWTEAVQVALITFQWLQEQRLNRCQ